jgi:septum formation protein
MNKHIKEPLRTEPRDAGGPCLACSSEIHASDQGPTRTIRFSLASPSPRVVGRIQPSKASSPIAAPASNPYEHLNLPRLDERVAATAPEILLASRSPRRRELLDAAGVKHVAFAPVFDDSALHPGTIASPAHWVCSLAYLKAWSQAAAHPDATMVLGSDTACVLDERLIGTPATVDEARVMIRDFQDREHQVVTGVAIIDRRSGRLQRHLFSDSARVWMGRLDETTLETYLAGAHWQGKAGGYNLLDRMNAGWPLTYEGDPTTIMGLPMNRLIDRLNVVLGPPGRP